MDAGSLIAGGGAAALIIALVYVGRLGLDWLREKRSAPVAKTTAAVTDAAAANAVLVQTVETLQAETSRQARKIKHLEDEAAEKDAKIEALEQRLNEAQGQIQTVAAELAALKGPAK